MPVLVQSNGQILAQKREEARLENELAIKIADILIKETAEKEKKSSGKKATPFVKEALPGEDPTSYTSNYVFSRFVMLVAAFLVLEQLFIFSVAYENWGSGNRSMLIVTVMQIAHAAYAFMLAYAPKASDLLNTMYGLRYVYFGLIGAIALPMGLLTFIAFVSLMQSD